MSLSLKNLDFIKLTAGTELLPFHCEDEDLNSFLRDDAKNYLRDLMAVTYLFVDKSNSTIAAYFSLLNDKVAYNPDSKNVWNRINRHIHNNKRRKSYPSVKIGRLAVSDNYARMGLGSDILSFIKRSFSENNRTGCRFVTVDAYRSAIPFYRKNDFEFFTSADSADRTRLMYFDLKKIQ